MTFRMRALAAPVAAVADGPPAGAGALAEMPAPPGAASEATADLTKQP